MTEGRLTKEELREDKVVTAITRAGDYVKQHAVSITVVVGIVVAGLIVAQIVRQGRARGEEQAAVLLLDAEALLRNGSAAEAVSRFVEAAERYGGTRSGKIALLRVGDCSLEIGEWEGAKDAYERYLETNDPHGLTRSSALRGLAATLDSMGELEEAARRFLEASEIAANPLRADDLLSAATALVEAGKVTEAIEVYQRLIATYPDHPRTREAREGLVAARAQIGS